jgi:hypothetical protein
VNKIVQFDDQFISASCTSSSFYFSMNYAVCSTFSS